MLVMVYCYSNLKEWYICYFVKNTFYLIILFDCKNFYLILKLRI